jgi:hypothetical protein
MCLPKPKVDPNVAELTRQQKADADEAAREVQLDISEQKQEDKDLAITERAAKTLRRRGGSSSKKRYSMLNPSSGSTSNFGQRFS